MTKKEKKVYVDNWKHYFFFFQFYIKYCLLSMLIFRIFFLTLHGYDNDTKKMKKCNLMTHCMK